MQILEVRISRRVFRKIDRIVDRVTELTSRENARRYGRDLLSEMLQLAIYGRSIRKTDSVEIKSIHPEAKSITTRNKKWRIVFHIEGDCVIVDDILFSSMITR